MLRKREAVIAALRVALVRRSEVTRAWLFGSLARDEAQGHSDVDVAVLLEPRAMLDAGWDAAEIGADLVDALGRNDVDVVVLDEAPAALRERAMRAGWRAAALARSRALEPAHRPMSAGHLDAELVRWLAGGERG
jgi:predicted nucleotidyltransferase